MTASEWPCGEDTQFEEVMNALEAIGNLLYLIQIDAESPDLVRGYITQVEERLSRLRSLIAQVSQRGSR